MAEFYRACSQVWAGDKKFWMDLSQAEIKHAQNIEKMSKFLSEKPESFRLGRTLKPAAVQTAISGVRTDIEKLKRGQLPLYKALFTAQDIEQSIIESRYAEFLKTDDVEFISLMGEVVSDTKSHLDRLIKKIEEMSG